MPGSKNFLRKLFGDKRANIMIITAVVMVPLIGAIGLAIDSTRAFIVKDRLQKSIDAAGLAAGRATTDNDRIKAAEDYFALNFDLNENLGKKVAFDLQFDDVNQTITINATAQTSASFMRIFGHDTLNIVATTVIQREVKGAEVVLVMDNTGSMRSGGKIDAMKDAATDLVDILYGSEETLENFWMALVPYAITVNMGNDRTNWLKFDDQYYDSPDPFAPTEWKGCVMARAGDEDQTETPPTSESDRFNTFLWETNVDNAWTPVDEANLAKNDGTGPNLGCGPAITALVADKSVIQAGIDEMLPWHRGGTASNLGLVWGWRVLSPDWQGLWGGDTPNTLPLDYNEPTNEKIAIVLTDGKNQFYDWPNHSPNGGKGPKGSDYTTYGRLADFGFNTLGEARAELDNRFATICGRMKTEGITLYTITFGSTPDSATKSLYQNCATKPGFYFHAPTNNELASIFKVIAGQISNLRIAK